MTARGLRSTHCQHRPRLQMGLPKGRHHALSDTLALMSSIAAVGFLNDRHPGDSSSAPSFHHRSGFSSSLSPSPSPRLQGPACGRGRPQGRARCAVAGVVCGRVRSQKVARDAGGGGQGHDERGDQSDLYLGRRCWPHHDIAGG